MADKLNLREPAGRKERIPLGGQRLKMSRPKKKGYVRRWIDARAGRLEAAKAAGYRHVHLQGEERGEDKRNTQETMIVGVNEDGSPRTDYLMEQPQSFYDEDQKKKEEPLEAFDKVLRRGNIVGANAKDTENYYVPDQGISVKTGTE